MKIALIGYGKMGREIEKTALERGHTIVSIIDVNNQEDFDSLDFLFSAEVAIEFTRPDKALDNYKKCFERNIPVVAGTTGWLEHLDEVKKECKEKNQTFFYASNYSIGVNIFYAVNEYVAKILNRFQQYDVRIEEIHHIHKLDSPSGTAITLADKILNHIDRKNQWKKSSVEHPGDLSITCKRQGEVTGIHEVLYESDADIISIRHEAKNRKGFALGAVLAAEFIKGKTGFLTMNDMLKFTI
ncbi:MAG: 4-hydroxy-tetrahydrodipicolinate reductase [Dysgonamonadaceae bacterium]|jgi:4-hydroxy-tetrahydrodipicolinate reductase|nr:4-hydroxy-tetrahydrodipicolinate reductase [Dysgonamonadaceae bacterium]